MKQHLSTVPNRVAVAMAVAAGVLTGALWLAEPPNRLAPRQIVANQTIDPTIPALTIVAKKLSAVERQQLAGDARHDDDVGRLQTTATLRQVVPADAF